jgi:hypothetical protein
VFGSFFHFSHFLLLNHIENLRLKYYWLKGAVQPKKHKQPPGFLNAPLNIAVYNKQIFIQAKTTTADTR